MTSRELAEAARRAYRDRHGTAAERPDPEDVSGLIAGAEEELGFPLPKLVGVLFAVGGPDFVDLDFAMSKYAERYEEGRAADVPGYWPPRMLPVKDLQGEIDWLCVDCTSEAGAVYVYYDNWDGGEPCWPGQFEAVSASLEDFLYGFVETGEFPPGRADPEDPDGR